MLVGRADWGEKAVGQKRVSSDDEQSLLGNSSVAGHRSLLWDVTANITGGLYSRRNVMGSW